MNTTLIAHGMSCASCAAKVEKALLALPAVSNVAVNVTTGRVFITHEPSVDVNTLASTVTSLGYQIEDTELTLSVEGMSCAGCVAKIESAVKTLPGVTEVAISLGTGTARVR